jgi:hypothetical protein
MGSSQVILTILRVLVVVVAVGVVGVGVWGMLCPLPMGDGRDRGKLWLTKPQRSSSSAISKTAASPY